MDRVKMFLWLTIEMHEKFKQKCKAENVTMQRKYIELVKEYLKK